MLNRYGLVLRKNAATSYSQFTPAPYSGPFSWSWLFNHHCIQRAVAVSFEITKYEETKKVLTTGLH